VGTAGRVEPEKAIIPSSTASRGAEEGNRFLTVLLYSTFNPAVTLIFGYF